MLRTTSRWIAAALLATSALAVASVTQAQQPQPPQQAPARGDRMFSRMQRNLGLTDDQVTQIKGIYGQQRDAFKQLHQTMRQTQTELRQLALSSGDPNAIAAKKAQVAQLMAQGLELRVQTLQQIGPILTPDQRDKLAQMGPAAMWRGHRHHKSQQQS
jgi:Spy/CpxP family protein refolding chaperone